MTHWATWDAPRYRRLFLLAACGKHVTDRELARPGTAPSCPICLRHYREFESLNVGGEEADPPQS